MLSPKINVKTEFIAFVAGRAAIDVVAVVVAVAAVVVVAVVVVGNAEVKTGEGVVRGVVGDVVGDVVDVVVGVRVEVVVVATPRQLFCCLGVPQSPE